MLHKHVFRFIHHPTAHICFFRFGLPVVVLRCLTPGTAAPGTPAARGVKQRSATTGIPKPKNQKWRIDVNYSCETQLKPFEIKGNHDSANFSTEPRTPRRI